MKRAILAIALGLAANFGICPAFAGIYTTMVLNFHPNPAYCQDFINSGALFMTVNPGIPESVTGPGVRAIVNSNSTVALLNIKPGYTTIVPALKRDIYCSAKCAIANQNPSCWKACDFVVNNFYDAQTPTYAVPNGTIVVTCPTLTMSKYLNYPGYPYSNYSYTRP